MSVTRTKKSKRPDTRPARARYWSTRRLRDHKVRNIMRSTGLMRYAALNLWESQRKGRMKP